MKQIKKTLCTLALGLFGVLAVNAQTSGNLVKNGTFRNGETDTKGTTEHWTLNSSVGGKLAVENGSKLSDAYSLTVKNTATGDYVSQKITGINATNFEFSFAVKGWYNYANVKLVWSTNKEEEIFNHSQFMDNLVTKYPSDYTKFDSYYHWYPAKGHPETNIKILGEVPQGATWVEIRFVDGGDIEGVGTPDFIAFYIDDVVFKTSGTPIVDPLDAPQNLKVENVTAQGAKITWDAVKDATSYQVKINGQTYTATTNSYEAASLSAGTKYSVEVKGYSEKTKDKDNKKSTTEFFTLSTEKADGTNVFFEGGDFTNGVSDLNKGWEVNSQVATEKVNIDGKENSVMRIQNSTTSVAALSYDFSVEKNGKYTISAMGKAPTAKDNEKMVLGLIWKDVNGNNIKSVEIGKTQGDSWTTIANEVVAPDNAVVAQLRFTLPSGDHHGGNQPIFYVDDVKVIKGVVAPKVEVKDMNQRNVKVSYMGIEGKTYKATLNGKEITLSKDGYINGLKPGTEYTVEVYSTDATDKKGTKKFTTAEITEADPIAYLANIDADGNTTQEFFYNIKDLTGDEVEKVEFTYNGSPVQPEEGKVKLPSAGGKLVVVITQKGGAKTTLTYNIVNF